MTPEEIAAIIEDHKYPTLQAGDTGINVSTLQIWLKMLGPYQGPITGFLDTATAQAVDGFRAQQLAAGVALQAPPGAVLDRDTWAAMDNLLEQRLPPDPSTLERPPFPRRSAYDSEEKYEKAVYEGLKRFGFSTPTAQKRLEVRLMTNIDGVGELSGIPPGDYDLTIESLNSKPKGSAEVRLVDAEGLPVIGTVVLSGPDGNLAVTTQPDGTAALDGLEPGEYTLSLKDARPRSHLPTTGSTKIHLVNQDGKPVSANLLLSSDMGEPEALQENIRLFKAMAFDLRLPIANSDQPRFPNILSNELNETRFTQEVWNKFTSTWGAFHGAPWLGIIIDSFDPGVATFDTYNWAARETIMTLYKWGNHYLASSQNPEQLKSRLQRPVAIRHLSHSRGQRVVDRSDFSQIGTACSLHRPRKTPRTIDDRVIDQFYGDVSYDSPDYDRDSFEQMTLTFIEVDSGFRVRSPDTILVDYVSHLYSDININLQADRYARNRLINLTVEGVSCRKDEPDITLWDHYTSPTGQLIQIMEWKSIDLNCGAGDKAGDHFRPGNVTDRLTFTVPDGIRPSIHLLYPRSLGDGRPPTDFSSAPKILVENGYPEENLVVSVGPRQQYQKYQSRWHFRYYFETLSNDYPVQLYGFQLEEGKVVAMIKAAPLHPQDGDRLSPFKLRPLEPVELKLGLRYPVGCWYRATVPHVPGILVHYHDPNGGTNNEVYSSLTGQVMGYLLPNGTITPRPVTAPATAQTGIYRVTNVLPNDSRGYLTHITGDFDPNIPGNRIAVNLAREVFVWDVLAWRFQRGQSGFTHSLDSSSIMTTAVWKRIQDTLRPLTQPPAGIFNLTTRGGTPVLPTGGPATLFPAEAIPPPIP